MWNEFLLLFAAHIVAVASPGADFAVVVKNTLRSGRVTGLYTAAGVGSGVSVHLIYTLLGIALLLSQSPMIFTAIKITGALYLLWIAWQAFHSRAKKAQAHEEVHFEMSAGQAFRQGFFTNVFNPKVTVFFLVLFTNIISRETPLWIQGIYGLWLAIYVMLWFMLVAWFFSREKVLAWYETHGHFIDWGMGGFLVLIALKLLFEF